MTTIEQTQQPRFLSPDELAILIKHFRDMRQWSQEQLAEISGLSVRTIQRIERGAPSDLDSRRGLSRAFEFDDIDIFNKPFIIPTEDEMKAQKEKFEREHITLDALPITTGKQLAGLVETSSADMSTSGFELTRETDEIYAGLIDNFRDYRDCAFAYSEREKFDIYDDFQRQIDALKELGVSLCYASRKVAVKVAEDAKPLQATVLYVVAFPVGSEPHKFATPKSGQVGW